MRILYVEDDPLVREIPCELLAQPEREILAVARAEEALGVFKPGVFDVVVTDVSLPAMAGLDWALRMLMLAPTIGIVSPTGYGPLVGMDRMGPRVRSIRKPFDVP